MRRPAKAQALEILKARGVPIETIIDVGVQHGTHELTAAFPDKKHILFEPVIEYRSSILNNYSKIDYELHVAAVSSRTGEATLEVRTIMSGKAITHSGLVADTAGKDQARLRKVPAIALDDFIPDGHYTSPFLLKIDIDGGELDVLRGAANTLKQSSVVIIETPKSQLWERIAAVKAAGFDLFDLAEPVYYDEAFWQCDAFFVRSDLHRKHFRQLGEDFRPELYVPFK